MNPKYYYGGYGGFYCDRCHHRILRAELETRLRRRFGRTWKFRLQHLELEQQNKVKGYGPKAMKYLINWEFEQSLQFKPCRDHVFIYFDNI